MAKKLYDNRKLEAPIQYDAEKFGESLIEVSVESEGSHADSVLSRWFHSDRDIDLFIWQDSQRNIIKQQINFCGQIVEWNILDGVKTGMVVQIENNSDKDDESILFDSEPMTTAISQAVELVKYAHHVQEPERKSISFNFKEAPTLSSMNVDEFFKRFGAVKTADSEKTLWNKIKTWLKPPD